ncbi:fibronectin type III domain-containing protein [Patescibacteria group bacterium]|nr:fibronectin type III domain-containing protein [Patescibacteria group bacterium]
MPDWVAEANWPVAWTSIYFSPMAVESGEFIVYAGGFEGTGTLKKFYKYNIDTNTWTELAVPPNYIASSISMSPDGSKLAAAISSYDILFIYDVGGNSWTSSAAAPAIGAVAVRLQSFVWADNDTLWVCVDANVAGTWTVKCFKYVVSTDTWTQYTNLITPAVHNAYTIGISPDGTTLYFGNCGSYYYKASRYVIATDTYTEDVIHIASAHYFTRCSDRNRLWYGANDPGPLAQIEGYIDLSDESASGVIFPDNASKTKPSNLTAGIYNGVSAIVYYCIDEPRNWSYIEPLPAVTTNPATALSTIAATLNGILDDDSGEACDCGFEYGETTAYGTTTPTDSKETGETFSQAITGLSPNTTYHFRAIATNSAGTSYGSDQTFTTLALAKPTVSTDAATSIEKTTTTLNGTLDDDGNEACDCGFEYGETEAYGTPTPTQSKETGETFAQAISGLTPGKHYHFRAIATNSAGPSYGSDRGFFAKGGYKGNPNVDQLIYQHVERMER